MISKKIIKIEKIVKKRKKIFTPKLEVKILVHVFAPKERKNWAIRHYTNSLPKDLYQFAS